MVGDEVLDGAEVGWWVWGWGSVEEFGVGVVVVESCDGEVELVCGLGDDGGVASCSDEDECWGGRHGLCIGSFW